MESGEQAEKKRRRMELSRDRGHDVRDSSGHVHNPTSRDHGHVRHVMATLVEALGSGITVRPEFGLTIKFAKSLLHPSPSFVPLNNSSAKNYL